jgi:hypothetical protein
MNMGMAKRFLDVGDGLTNSTSLKLVQRFDFLPKVLIQLDLFQTK